MKRKRIMELGSLLVPASVAVLANEEPLEAKALFPVTFTHGVASGDLTPFSAILWTRVDRKARLTVEVSTDPLFQEINVKRSVLASAKNDFTAKVRARPLRPDQTYFYRWRHGASLSELGTFTTAPPPFASANLRFAYSGDTDGTKDENGTPFFNDFEVLDTARAEDLDLDFFVYLGDTVYPDFTSATQPSKNVG